MRFVISREGKKNLIYPYVVDKSSKFCLFRNGPKNLVLVILDKNDNNVLLKFGLEKSSKYIILYGRKIFQDKINHCLIRFLSETNHLLSKSNIYPAF